MIKLVLYYRGVIMWNELTLMQSVSLLLYILVVVLSFSLIFFFTLKSKKNGTFFTFIAVQIAIFILVQVLF